MRYKSTIRPVRSVSHALQLFEFFRTADKEEFGVTELSKALGLHKNNIFRLLATLSSAGYIEQNMETENYRLGISIFNLGQKFVHKLSVLNLARPFMKKVVAEINESVYLGIVMDTSAIYLDIVETRHPVRVVSRVGKDVPAYAVAIGKVQLAHYDNERIDDIYQGVQLEQFTPNTVASLDDLKRQLKNVASLGYAIDDEELEMGVRCVAVPIKDYLGVSIASLSVTGPATRVSHKRIHDEILPILQDFSTEISKRLGYQQGA